MQQNLEKKFARLSFIHDNPALYVTEEFYELRNSIDIDTEELLVRFREAKIDNEADEMAKVNKTRDEFIRILQELEYKCLSQLPHKRNARSSSEKAYAHFRPRIEMLQACSNHQLKTTFNKLALELIDETYELEKRLFGEQTIIYVPSGQKNQLGNLVYIGEHRMRRHEIDCIKSVSRSNDTVLSSLNLEYISKPLVIGKNFLTVDTLHYFLSSASKSLHSKFIYMGQDEATYSGYSAENSSIDKEFVSYRFPMHSSELCLCNIAGIEPCLDLPDLAPSIAVCVGHIRSLDFLVPSSAHRLDSLYLENVLLDSFDGELIVNCVNLRSLKLNLYDSSAYFANLQFLRPLHKLSYLSISLKNFDLDLSVLKELPELVSLQLVGASDVNGNKTYPVLNVDTVFKRLAKLPHLSTLSICSFEIKFSAGFVDYAQKPLEIDNELG